MNSKGSILILCSWILIVLSLFAVGLASRVKQQAHVLNNLQHRDEVRLLSEAAIKEIVGKNIHRRRIQGFEDLNGDQRWKRLGNGKYRLIDPQVMNGASRNTRYVMMDENRNININHASAQTLVRLFSLSMQMSDEQAGRLAHAIIDYRDPDDHQSKYMESGSERNSYYMAGLPQRPKNRSFEILSELLLVKGMTPRIYQKVKPYLTVYGDGRVNINTANEMTFQVLDMDPLLARRLIRIRAGDDGLLGTMDDFVIRKLENAVNELKAVNDNIPEREIVSLLHLITQGRLNVQSDYVRVLAEAKTHNSDRMMRIACIFGFRSGIQYWMEQY